MKFKQPSIAPRAWLPRSAAIATGLLAIMAPVLPVFATPADNLVITENSSTSLTASWNGASITPTFVSSDHWTLLLPVPVFIGGEGEEGAAILEPGGGLLGPWNLVGTTPVPTGGLLVSVVSDSTTVGASSVVVTDGVSTSVGATIGTTAPGIPVFLTFHDAGDGGGTPTPDAGSTALLGVLSFLALFGVARFRAGSIPVR